MNLPITVIGDSIIEDNRRVKVRLSAVEGAPYRLSGLAATQGVTILINDDDGRGPKLTLGQAAHTVNETDGDVTRNITVRLSLTLYGGARKVNITTRHISTTAADVTVPESFTLPSNHQGRTIPGSYTFPITIHGDDDVEGPESFEIELSAAAGARYALGHPVKTTITINDDEFATLALGQAAYSVIEGDGALNIPVKINPALANASVVNITTHYDSATADDVSVPATLTLPAGQTSVDLQVPITADNFVEGDEKLEIELSAVADAPYKLGQQAKTAITIKDDDFAALAFSQAAWSVTEADSDGALSLTVNINPVLANASVVNITTRHISTAAADVTVPATLTLPAGQTSVELPITISGDDAIEGDETLEIELVAAADALYTLGDPGKATITINDDDQPSAEASALSRSAWTITVTPGDQELDVSWQPPPAVNVSDISRYVVLWCLEDEELGCSPTAPAGESGRRWQRVLHDYLSFLVRLRLDDGPSDKRRQVPCLCPRQTGRLHLARQVRVLIRQPAASS